MLKSSKLPYFTPTGSKNSLKSASKVPRNGVKSASKCSFGVKTGKNKEKQGGGGVKTTVGGV